MAIAFDDVAVGVVESAVGFSALVFRAGAVAAAPLRQPTRAANMMPTFGTIDADASGRVVPCSPSGTARA
jgi:hypothetical protein